jgi:uncharacterized membrane protein HdeD (DUF308 family)
MATYTMFDHQGARPDLPQGVRSRRLWTYVLGAGLILVGCLVLMATFTATLVSVMMLGWLLAFGGGFQIAHAIALHRREGLLLHLINGVVTLGVGLLMVLFPLTGAMAMTFLLGCYFLASGAFRVAWAALTRFHGWGWYVPGGLLGIVLGLLILTQWPGSGLWVIGLFLGLDLLLLGGSVLAVAALAGRFGPRDSGGGV